MTPAEIDVDGDS